MVNVSSMDGYLTPALDALGWPLVSPSLRQSDGNSALILIM